MAKFLNTISALQSFQLIRYSTLLAIGVVFAKLGMQQSAIGQYEFFLFIAAALSFFWLNGLLKALLPFCENNEQSKTNIFSAYILIQIFSVLAAVFLFLLQPIFSKYLLNNNGIPEIILLAIFLVFAVPANLVEYYYLIRNRSLSIVIYAIVSFGLQFALMVVPIFLEYPIKVALQGLVLSSLLRYTWLWMLFIKHRDIFISIDFIKTYLRLGAPLIAATFFSGSAQFIDGFIVTAQFDEATFAVFRYGARELPLALLLCNALSSAMLPRFSEQQNQKANLQKLKSSVTRLMYLLFPVSAILILISKPLFPVLFNPYFAKSAGVFNIYLLLIISRVLMPQTLLIGLKKSKPVLVASIFELLLNVGLSLIFVRFWGIRGIAFATIIAYLFEKIYLSYVVKRSLNIQLNQYLSVSKYVAFSLGILVIFIFTELFS